MTGSDEVADEQQMKGAAALRQLAEDLKALNGIPLASEFAMAVCAGLTQSFATRRLLLIFKAGGTSVAPEDLARIDTMLSQAEDMYVELLRDLTASLEGRGDE